MFGRADQAEIIRSNQKDSYYVSLLRGSLNDVAQTFLGPDSLLRWRTEFSLLADASYFSLTTLAGLQTLGEEYVNVVQSDGTLRAVPSLWRRGAMVALQVVAPYALDKGLARWEQSLRGGAGSLRPEARQALLHLLPIIRHTITLLHRCHLAWFYLRGIYYHIAKRLTGVNYLLVREGVGDKSTMNYRVLGWLSVIQLCLLCAQQLYRLLAHRSSPASSAATSTVTSPASCSVVEESHAYSDPSLKCPLCLEDRRNSTACPCGHLFCWHCITEWATTQNACPMCREPFEMSRLIFLQNYDPV